MDKKNSLINLGCRLNIYEGEIIKNHLKNNNIKNKNIGTMSLILLIYKVKNVLNMFFRLTSENKRS